MHAKPIAFGLVWVIVDPPKLGFRINPSVLLAFHIAGSIRWSTRHCGSSSGAPARRNARRDPSSQPSRHRDDSHRHRNLAVAHSRNSRQPGAISKPSNIPGWRRRRSTPSMSRYSSGFAAATSLIDPSGRSGPIAEVKTVGRCHYMSPSSLGVGIALEA